MSTRLALELQVIRGTGKHVILNVLRPNADSGTKNMKPLTAMQQVCGPPLLQTVWRIRAFWHRSPTLREHHSVF